MFLHSLGFSQIEIIFYELPKGKQSFTFQLPFFSGKEVEFIEKHHQYLILKQKNFDIIIFDTFLNTSHIIKGTSYLKSSSFLFLFSSGRLLIYLDRKFLIYLFSGEKIDEIQIDLGVDLNPLSVTKNHGIFICLS
jgi:hypothetical protein